MKSNYQLYMQISAPIKANTKVDLNVEWYQTKILGYHAIIIWLHAFYFLNAGTTTHRQVLKFSNNVLTGSCICL